MIRDQRPHCNRLRPAVLVVMLRLPVAVVLPDELHIRVMLPDKPDQLRRVNGCHGIMSVKLHPCHLAQVVHALRILPAAERHIIPIRRLKRLQPLNGHLHLMLMVPHHPPVPGDLHLVIQSDLTFLCCHFAAFRCAPGTFSTVTNIESWKIHTLSPYILILFPFQS